MENLRNRTDVKLVSNKKDYLKWTSKASYMSHDVTGTSPDGPLKLLMSWTYRGPSGDSQGTNTKTDDLIKKIVFLKQ